MFYGYSTSYFLAIFVFFICLVEPFSTRVIQSVSAAWACFAPSASEGPAVVDLCLGIGSSYGLDWPLN